MSQVARRFIQKAIAATPLWQSVMVRIEAQLPSLIDRMVLLTLFCWTVYCLTYRSKLSRSSMKFCYGWTIISGTSSKQPETHELFAFLCCFPLMLDLGAFYSFVLFCRQLGSASVLRVCLEVASTRCCQCFLGTMHLINLTLCIRATSHLSISPSAFAIHE